MDRKNRTHMLIKFLKEKGHMTRVIRTTMRCSPYDPRVRLIDEIGRKSSWPSSAISHVGSFSTQYSLDNCAFRWNGIHIRDFVRYIRSKGADPEEF